MQVLRWGALRGGLGAVVASLLLLGGGTRVRGQQADGSAERTYERLRVDRVLRGDGLRRAAGAEGKTIAFVRYVRREVFEGDDLLVPVVLPRFAPTWPNSFHWLTEQTTIERELLLREGQPYTQALADESMRNLRALGAFALVSVVPVETEDQSRVGVLVYTRDLWSLRLEQAVTGVGATFALDAALVERNFLGRNKTLSARFSLDPFTSRVGETYVDPRIVGGELQLYEVFDVTLNRTTGKAEGAAGTLVWGRPFYDLSQETSFDVLAHYRVGVERGASDGKVVGFDTRPGDEHGKRCAASQSGCVAKAWDERAIKLEAAAHRRLGLEYKQTFSAGAGFKDRDVEANEESGVQAGERAVFAGEVLPRVRREVYPLVAYRLSWPKFVTFENLGTFGQTESVRVGPTLGLRLAWPLGAFGSSSDGLVSQSSVGYVWAAQDALFDALAQGRLRLESQQLVDRVAALRVRAASPLYRWMAGRMVVLGVIDARQDDTQNMLVALGGDTGLRGFPSGYFYGFGASKWSASVEYRTRPWMLQSVHLGLVAFYDAGAVYRRVQNMLVHQAAGLGVRALFPHFNRHAFRMDFGVPVDGTGFALSVSYGTAQALALTPEEDALAGGLDLD